ncbi:MAG: hypothetical protein VYE80_00455 [Candidatus Thermoplasmatota archaeon]|nr:hypothetical protein [Candidatus Thermoplasmatota archaeon]
MTDLLFYAKIVLLLVLLYDVGILLRKPEEGSKVARLDLWKEMERKGINAFLIPSTMVFIICLDIVQEVNIYLSTALFVLSLGYLGYPRPFAFGENGILLDGKIIARDRILKAKRTEKGAKISIEWYGWLMEKDLPDCEVTDLIIEEFKD